MHLTRNCEQRFQLRRDRCVFEIGFTRRTTSFPTNALQLRADVGRHADLQRKLPESARRKLHQFATGLHFSRARSKSRASASAFAVHIVSSTASPVRTTACERNHLRCLIYGLLTSLRLVLIR
jgi:hypothetical protein